MTKKQKKQPPKSKSVLSNKKYILFFVILLGVLCLTLFQVSHKQTYQQQAATTTCGAPGDKGNAMGDTEVNHANRKNPSEGHV